MKKLYFEGDYDVLWTKNFFTQTILGKMFVSKQRNQVKIERNRKLWQLLLCNLWLLLQKFFLWKEI